MARWIARNLPTREQLLNSRWIKPFAHRLTHPLLWQANRRSVARGIALGLFAGFLVPIGQTPVAALLALNVRANIIVAACATLVTNPLTFPPIYYTAYKLGRRLLGDPAMLDLGSAWFAQQPAWALGPAWAIGIAARTGLGLLIFALASSLLGYCAVHLFWRVRTAWRWRKRAAARTSLGLELSRP